MALASNDLSEREERFGEIAFAYLRAKERGPCPDPQEWFARYPEFGTELAGFLADRDEVDRLAAPLRAIARAASPEAALTDWPGATVSERAAEQASANPFSWGDYELLGEIARGGMGVVYRARQKSLNRLLALKMVRGADRLDPEQVRRFRNEAETVALLDHPHIVPVYEVGEHDGQLYFSMKLIEGGTAAGSLGRFAADPRAAARLLAQVARAVHHAHQRGVLHRDLKPSNVLLDAEGRPHVTDFGLAKRIESDSSLTQSGALVGTPSYMAPEQTSGVAGTVTTASDVYGLGATLYALLTGRPPFQGATALDTLAQVREREPEQPERLNPKVDRDLQTVCLKCLQKDPAKRYGSAAALADDLERWLRREPVEARPTGMTARVRRWCGRNPIVAGLTASALFLLLVVLVGAPLSIALLLEKQAQNDAAYRTAEQKRKEADERRREALENLKDAHAAVDQLLTRVGRDKLADTPHMERVRRELLTDALRFYQKFLQKKDPDGALQVQAARAYIAAGAIQLKLGDPREAENSIRQGLALLRKMLTRQQVNLEYQDLLAEGWIYLGQARLWAHRTQEAEEAFQKARSIATRLVTVRPRSLAYREHLARACADLGTTYARSGRPQQAEGPFREALRLGEQLLLADAENLPYQQTVATVQANLGTLLAQLGNGQEGEKRVRQAVAIQEKVVTREPSPQHRAYLANLYRSLGLRQSGGGRREQAAKTQQQAVQLWSQLHHDFPHVPDYAHGYARSLLFAGKDLMALGRDRAALVHLSDAERLYSGLAKGFPKKDVYRRELSWCCFERGWLLAASYDKQVRQPVLAIASAKRAVDLAPDDGKHWAALGMAYYRAGQWDAALQPLQEASKHRQPGARIALFFLAMTHGKLGRPEEGRKWYERAEAWRRQNAPKDGMLAGIGREAAQVLGLRDQQHGDSNNEFR
jgi:tetratricopeptide (TPR) repeat protein